MAKNITDPGVSAPPGTLYSIGEAADLLGVSIPTIRLYEQQGLIIPLRKASRHRRFAVADLERIRSIRRMINSEKISIEGVKRMLSLIPCWKIKNCPEHARTSCPAFSQHDAPCWMVTNKRWDCKSAECRICPVYADVADSGALKRVIAVHTVGDDGHM